MAYRKVRSKPPVTQARLKELLRYDPETGLFTNIKRRHGAKLGAIVGCVNKASGYLVICIDYQNYYASRLAWFYMTGAWPAHEVDHENGDRADNRWDNLREATRGEQMQNITIKSNNTSGLIGVHPNAKHTRWHAEIRVNGRKRWLGSFLTAEEAHAAYVAAKAELHTFNPTVRAVEPA